MRRELDWIEIPGEHEARERAWRVVSAAFAEREPTTPKRSWKPLAALAVVIAVVAGLVTPPGSAVLDEIREVVGVEKAQPALFSLPARGRLLVTADSGAWVVEQDGSKRLLGSYREASWSPFGTYVIATRQNELVALEPDGDVRWSLARSNVLFPRWTGTTTDTRIAYLSGTRVRVVGGDGRNDRRACADSVALRPPEWRPGRGFILAFVASNGAIHVYETERCELLWRSRPGPQPHQLIWSSDGSRLLAFTENRLVTYRGSDGRATSRRLGGTGVAALASDGRLALVRTRGGNSDVLVEGRVRFSSPGALPRPAWTPDGSWLLVPLPQADQWIFIRAKGRSGLRAVSNLSNQFRSRSSPHVEGWCCER